MYDTNFSLIMFQQMDNGKLFEGECIPDWEKLHELYTDMDSDKYPHSWRGAVICFVIGLGLMVITDLFALLTVCCRSCICCSVFTICGSFQSFAGILFTLGKKILSKFDLVTRLYGTLIHISS